VSVVVALTRAEQAVRAAIVVVPFVQLVVLPPPPLRSAHR
jgi:hypothetical protein